MKGLLLVISGPSGVGKGTLVEMLKQARSDMHVSISATTRQPGPGDVNGVHYFFKTEEEFVKGIEEGAFLEWAKVFKNYYGTPKATVLAELEKGKNVILEIDTAGAMQVKKAYEEAVLIFIAPPSKAELRRRIESRGRDTREQIEHRLSMAGQEVKMLPNYDYAIVNDDLEKAFADLVKIIEAQKFAAHLHHDLVEDFLKGEEACEC